MKKLYDHFFGSMTGRIFMVLVAGMVACSALALSLAEAKRDADLHRLNLERAIDRAENFVAMLSGVNDTALRTALSRTSPPGIRAVDNDMHGATDMEMTTALQRRLGSFLSTIEAQSLLPADCATDPAANGRPVPGCWLVTVTLHGGDTLRFTLATPIHILDQWPLANPFNLAVLVAVVAVLAYLVAQMAAAPLSRLAEAAQSLGSDLQRPALEEKGPTEVRAAARAFNLMQQQLTQSLSQRMQMLASITHDLRTPLTRLRLRLEKVSEPALRERLIGDLAMTDSLIQEGLELARVTLPSPEAPVRLDLDSMLASMVDDETDAGNKVFLMGSSGLKIMARPNALRRCLANLVDNALKYGGAASILIDAGNNKVSIRIRDDGPGLPAEHLEHVFEPFVRMESSRSRETGGTGLGLTIARTLAQQQGGHLVLENRPEGGLDAILTLPLDGMPLA